MINNELSLLLAGEVCSFRRIDRTTRRMPFRQNTETVLLATNLVSARTWNLCFGSGPKRLHNNQVYASNVSFCRASYFVRWITMTESPALPNGFQLDLPPSWALEKNKRLPDHCGTVRNENFDLEEITCEPSPSRWLQSRRKIKLVACGVKTVLSTSTLQKTSEISYRPVAGQYERCCIRLCLHRNKTIASPLAQLPEIRTQKNGIFYVDGFGARKASPGSGLALGFRPG